MLDPRGARDLREDRRGTRGGDPRQAREDRGTPEDSIQYFDDMGFTSTQQIHDSVMDDEAEFAAKVRQQRGVISAENQRINGIRTNLDAEYDKALGQLGAQRFKPQNASREAAGAWRSTPKTLVRVVNGGTVEAQYYLPPSAAADLHGRFRGGNSYSSAFFNGNSILNIDTRIGGHPYGKELHQAMISGQKVFKDKIYTSAYNQVAQNNVRGAAAWKNSYNKAKGTLDTSYAAGLDKIQGANSTLGKATTSLNAVESDRAAEWEVLRNDYRKRLDNMRSMWTVKEATNEQA